ncbi:MAG: M23 family metallopeptidase, partial [Desulfobacterales bacterium]|nr:M23 family metallopeptidase [Desulfobacterales bacterium]
EEFVTVYAHNQVNLVEEGTRVEKGKIIAKVGQTGRASGPHLHFEIRKNNKAIDPFLVLK